jgi:hypothetical protein
MGEAGLGTLLIGKTARHRERTPGLQGLALGWTLAASIDDVCVAAVFGFAAKLDSASAPEHQGPAPAPFRT